MGKFAMICVEINQSKPPISKYKLDGKKYFIEYESIHMISFECGKYDHLTEKCPKNPMVSDSTPEQPVQEGVVWDDANFGPWMVVKKIRRNRKAKITSTEAGQKQQKNYKSGSKSCGS